MKQLLPLSLSLFLLPCLAWAQYPSNGNQKITLGEQTTADGLIFRGVAATDTVRKPSIDTMAYMVLDTTTNIMWHYKKATSNAWLRLNLLPSDTASMLTNYYRSGRALGTPSSGVLTSATGLPIGTGLTGLGAANRIPYASSTTALTTSPNLTYSNATLNVIGGAPIVKAMWSSDNTKFTSLNYDGFNTSGNQDAYYIAPIGRKAFWYIGSAEAMALSETGLGVGIGSPTQKLHVVGNARITAMNAINDIGADANGVLQAATSDMNLKNTIENSPFGLNEILLLNPVTFLYNDTNRKIDSDVKEVGFIAQDVFDIIPNAVSSTGTGDLQLDYRAITATLVKAIQEQTIIIKQLEERIKKLEER
jgi:hypothetical protein